MPISQSNNQNYMHAHIHTHTHTHSNIKNEFQTKYFQIIENEKQKVKCKNNVHSSHQNMNNLDQKKLDEII